MEENKLTSIQKIKAIMSFLSIKPYKYKVAKISEGTGINRATVYRILYELMEDGFVIQDENTGKFTIGPTLYNIGMVYLNNCNYQSKMLEILEQASELTKESIGLAVRDGDRVISIYETEIHQPLKMRYKAGTFYPINRGCYGKILMSYYDEVKVKKLLYSEKFIKVCKNTLTDPEEILEEYRKIRDQGYAISDEETFPLAVAVGAPIFNSNGEVKSCVVVAFLKDDEYLNKINKFINVIKDTSNELSKIMP